LNYTRIHRTSLAASATLVYNSTIKRNCQIFFRSFWKKVEKNFLYF